MGIKSSALLIGHCLPLLKKFVDFTDRYVHVQGLPIIAELLLRLHDKENYFHLDSSSVAMINFHASTLACPSFDKDFKLSTDAMQWFRT